MEGKHWSKIVTDFGPLNIIFLAISTPKPLRPIIKILRCINFFIVSIPIVPIWREYKFKSFCKTFNFYIIIIIHFYLNY